MRGRKGSYQVFIERAMTEFLMCFNLMVDHSGKEGRGPGLSRVLNIVNL
jgi:hypothetical protein